MRACSVSVDLDEVHHYLAIHGLSDADVPKHVVYDIALPRLLEWAARKDIPLTLFAVGNDLSRIDNRGRLMLAAGRGHEIGNHSHSHAYDLSRRAESEIEADVLHANRLIEEVTGTTPRGFRAPGYTITQAMYAILDRAGFAYSSSVFPCPPYYGAKAAAIGIKRLLGFRSSSVLDDPRVLLSPTQPYRVGRPYWKRGVGLLELPIHTTRWLRLPFIGTSLTLLGPRGASWLTAGVLGAGFVNLELHGVDVLGKDDGLGPLAAHQYDLGLSVERKLGALDAAVERLARAGYEFRTLEDVALAFD